MKIDGAEATAENIESGTYKVSRPFNIVTKDGLSDVAQDFINFIMSTQGQEVVADEGYIPVDTTTRVCSFRIKRNSYSIRIFFRISGNGKTF